MPMVILAEAALAVPARAFVRRLGVFREEAYLVPLAKARPPMARSGQWRAWRGETALIGGVLGEFAEGCRGSSMQQARRDFSVW